MRMTPRVIVKKLIRRWSISSSARCCDSHALLMISWFTTMSQKNVSDNGSEWCSDTTRRRQCTCLRSSRSCLSVLLSVCNDMTHMLDSDSSAISEELEDSSEHVHQLLTGSVLLVYRSTRWDNLDYGRTQVDLGCNHTRCEGHFSRYTPMNG